MGSSAHAARGPTALAYVRCSSYRNQHTGLGEETQRRLIASYFEPLKQDRPDLQWGGSVEEKAVSAFKRPLFRRPEGSKLCRLLKPGDHIIFACLDRAFRQIKDLILGREWFEGQQVYLHFVQERIDTSTETGWLMLHIYGLPQGQAVGRWSSITAGGSGFLAFGAGCGILHGFEHGVALRENLER